MLNKQIPVEVYSRVVGYYRPVSQWNNGKKSEFNDRYFFDISEVDFDNKTADSRI